MPAPHDAAESGHPVPRQRTAADVREELNRLSEERFRAHETWDESQTEEMRRRWIFEHFARYDDLLDELGQALGRES